MKQFAQNAQRNAQQGLTLIELMVALVLGLVLVGGVLNVFVANRETYRATENLTRIQENARTGFDFMARDLREAGQNPCGTPLVANVIRDTSNNIPWWADWNKGTLIGVDGGQDRTDIVGFGTSIGMRVAGTDAILVIKAEQNEKIITAHTPATSSLTLAAVSGIYKGDAAIVCDMHQAAILQLATGSVVEDVPNPVSYAPADASFNCNANLGHPTSSDCATPIPAPRTFAAGGRLSKLSSSFWYVGYNGTQRSLYRRKLSNEIVAGVTTPTPITEEIVPGVQDLQLEYLTSDGGTLASDWVTASDGTTFTGATATTTGNWQLDQTNKVVAVRLNMTLQSEEKIGTNQQAIQRQLIHVVALRSRDYLF